MAPWIWSGWGVLLAPAACIAAVVEAGVLLARIIQNWKFRNDIRTTLAFTVSEGESSEAAIYHMCAGIANCDRGRLVLV